MALAPPDYLVTVTVHVTVLPSTVIVIAVVPALRAVISPAEVTVAIAVDLDLYVDATLVALDGAIIGVNW